MCFAYVHLCTMGVAGLCPQRPEEALGALKLEFQMIVNHHMGSGDHLHPLQEQKILLTTKIFFQPLSFFV